MKEKHIVWMDQVRLNDVAKVGGKNASLGELISSVGPHGVRVPGGFIVTAEGYRYLLASNALGRFIKATLRGLDVRDLRELAKRGKRVRAAIRDATFPADLAAEITSAYHTMEKMYGKNADVAVRSSATAEDLPDASFAGQQETYLGIRGATSVQKAILWTMASLYTDRAIAYRAEKGYSHIDVALSVGVQKMVRSDKAGSGVMFTVDTETGFRNAIVINAAYGLGELVVQGRVIPDEYIVFKEGLSRARNPIIEKTIGVKERKMIYAHGRRLVQTTIVATTRSERHSFVLSDAEIITLARWGAQIERHYEKRSGKWCPMDIEWAKDGKTGELFVVQARPETVQSKRDPSIFEEYSIVGKPGRELARGISVGAAITTGVARVIRDVKGIGKFKQGEILITKMTDPDWGPIMKIASAIVTDSGGRTSHAAIVSRELGIPAIVGAGAASQKIKNGMMITVDVSGTVGRVYQGAAQFKIRRTKIDSIPKTKTKLMLNIASPEKAFEYSFLPVSGVGLAREEFIIAAEIGIHPRALLDYKHLPRRLQRAIDVRMRGWSDPRTFYVDKLAFGIARIAAAFFPRPVIVRFSDFKSNEYAGLMGGNLYEPKEENPMIGWRGASRYYSPKFRDAFALECESVRKVRSSMGLDNVIPMVPFCRTIDEAKKVLAVMAEEGIEPNAFAKKKKHGTPVYMMCEIPSNAILADEFLDLFDGFSIGSNDLTQLGLGLDRDSSGISTVGNENDPAIRRMVSMAIERCRARGKYSGICGQGPSDLPDFAEFLVRSGIQSMSLNPDTVLTTLLRVAKLEKKIRR